MIHIWHSRQEERDLAFVRPFKRKLGWGGKGRAQNPHDPQEDKDISPGAP